MFTVIFGSRLNSRGIAGSTRDSTPREREHLLLTGEREPGRGASCFSYSFAEPLKPWALAICSISRSMRATSSRPTMDRLGLHRQRHMDS